MFKHTHFALLNQTRALEVNKDCLRKSDIRIKGQQHNFYQRKCNEALYQLNLRIIIATNCAVGTNYHNI